MFVRVETGFQSEFSDPEAARIHTNLTEIHPALAEKIRWMRKLKVYWIELSAPRDKVVQAIQATFKNAVTDWLFTGDLLPSAGGSTGTLYDLMQESPFRPGVFHGIEKRKRLHAHDEEALIIQQMLQTVLGRKTHQDRVVTGELLLLEGLKLTQSDLEWVARNWFAHEKSESWSLLSEEELKRNSRFQSEQVGKYLTTSQTSERSRLLQFRQGFQKKANPLDWAMIEEQMRAPLTVTQGGNAIPNEEGMILPEIRFATSKLDDHTQGETEFHLVKQQLSAAFIDYETRLQTVLGVVPEKHRLWLGEVHGAHPLRVHEEFEIALKRVAETTATPVVQMKVLEDSHEGEPSYFWSTSLALGEHTKINPLQQGAVVDLIFIGHSETSARNDLHFVQSLKSAFKRCKEGQSIEFGIASTGMNLLEALKRSEAYLKYGFDLVIDGMSEWFQKSLNTPLVLSAVWGVKDDKKAFVLEELEARNIPYLHFGSTGLTGEVRVLEFGELRCRMLTKDFFKVEMARAKDDLVDEPLFTEERPVQPAKFKNRFSVEELLLKPETYHVSVSSPVVIRPRFDSWGGLMVLSDLCGQEFDGDYLEYLFRKCTAISGQIHSMQVSMVNGLSSWLKVLTEAQSEFGIHLSQVETVANPDIKGHWLALQMIARLNDIRSIRSEDFKIVHDRIYWLPGSFEQPATRWLAGMEGRYQASIHSAVAIESTRERAGVIDTLTYALLKHRLGAEVRLQHHFAGGFFVSVSENERFSVEEEWRAMDINFEFVGRVTSSPFLVIRDENDRTHTISIEDMV